MTDLERLQQQVLGVIAKAIAEKDSTVKNNLTTIFKGRFKKPPMPTEAERHRTKELVQSLGLDPIILDDDSK